MLSYYCNTKVKSSIEVVAGAGVPRFIGDSGSTKPTIKRWLAVVLCIALVFPTAGFSGVGVAMAEGETYLFNKVIEWNDGTTEHVQLDDDKFFVIDGEKRRLVSIQLMTSHLPHGEQNGQFYLTENMAILEKELTYLESVGVRLVHVDLRYVRWYGDHSVEFEDEVYTEFLDLLCQHKMLVIPMITGKWMPNFNNLTNPDFSWGLWDETDSMGAWARRWAEIVSRYPNVVGVIADNELDSPLTAARHWDPNAVDQEYGPSEVRDYLSFLTDILRPIGVPILHKLMANPLSLDIKSACLTATDFPSFTVYDKGAKDMNANLDSLVLWLEQSGCSASGWWCMELNNGWPPTNIEDFNMHYVDSVFDHGAAIATLFPSNWTGEPTWSFFDDNGDPVPKLREIAPEFARWQMPIIDESPIILAGWPFGNSGMMSTRQ